MPDLDLKPDEFVSVPDTPMVRKRDFWAGMAFFAAAAVFCYWLAWYTDQWWVGLLAAPNLLWMGTLVAGRFPRRMFYRLDMLKRPDK